MHSSGGWMACAYEELGQTDENVTDEFSNGAVEIDGEVTCLKVEVGGYGNGDVSDFAHGFASFGQWSVISGQGSEIGGQWSVASDWLGWNAFSGPT